MIGLLRGAVSGRRAGLGPSGLRSPGVARRSLSQQPLIIPFHATFLFGSERKTPGLLASPLQLGREAVRGQRRHAGDGLQAARPDLAATLLTLPPFLHRIRGLQQTRPELFLPPADVFRIKTAVAQRPFERPRLLGQTAQGARRPSGVICPFGHAFKRVGHLLLRVGGSPTGTAFR